MIRISTRAHCLQSLQDNDSLLNVKFIGNHLLCVRERSIELCAVPLWSESLNRFEKKQHEHAYLQTDHAAREAVIITRSQASRDCQGWPKEPVTILMRYTDEGFDMIQQYDLLPKTNAQTPIPAGAKAPRPGTDELPCIFPTQYTRVISVAPSCCRLHVGHSGKGFWMQTRNVSTRHSVYPARCLVGFDILRPKVEHASEAREKGDSGAAARGKARDVPQQNDLHLCDGELYARRCDMSEIMWRKYVISSADLEDTVGRIAVGDREGKVVVLDYV